MSPSALGRVGRGLARHLHLTPKVRAIIRTLIAKAGRWRLADEHPELTPNRASGRGLPTRYVMGRAGTLGGRRGTALMVPIVQRLRFP